MCDLCERLTEAEYAGVMQSVAHPVQTVDSVAHNSCKQTASRSLRTATTLTNSLVEALFEGGGGPLLGLWITQRPAIARNPSAYSKGIGDDYAQSG